MMTSYVDMPVGDKMLEAEKLSSVIDSIICSTPPNIGDALGYAQASLSCEEDKALFGFLKHLLQNTGYQSQDINNYIEYLNGTF